MPICPKTAAVFSGVDPLPGCLALTDTPVVQEPCDLFEIAFRRRGPNVSGWRGFPAGLQAAAGRLASSFAPSVRQYSLEAVRISNLSPATAGLARQSSSRSFCSDDFKVRPGLDDIRQAIFAQEEQMPVVRRTETR